MAITAISRDFNETPNIVRVTATNTLAEVAAADYVTAQTDNITALNSGTWTWVLGDVILIAASDGSEFFRFSGSDFTSFIQLPGGNGAVTLPVVDGDFTVFDGTLGALKDLGFLPSNAAKTRVVMAGSAVQVGYLAHFVDTTGTIDDTAGNVINAGNIQAGLSGTAGTIISYPAAAANGNFIWAAVGNAGNFSMTVSPISTLGQASVITIPDPGAATANFMLDAGTTTAKTITTLTSTTANITNLKYGATPVAQVDPASCTITAAAGAANTSTVTIQLKDGSGTNLTRSMKFTVYSSSASDGLTLASAASTGYSVASGGLSLANATAITTQITAMSSATGGCVLSLLDTAKLTSFLVLVLPNGNKISAQLTAGSYG
jgi:hypothetical protein